MGTHPDIQIVRAGPEEIRQLVSLLPHAAGQPTQSDFFAAIRDGQLIGGTALMISKGQPNTSRRASFQLVMTNDDFSPDAADMLTHAMKVVARREGASSLTYSDGIMEGCDLEQILKRCNFSMQGEAISHFTIQIGDPSWKRFDSMYEKLKERGKIPKDAKVLPLNRISMMPVTELLQKTIGGAGEAVQAELLNPDTASIGIQIGSVLHGLHVIQVRDDKAHTSHLAIDKKARVGWLFTALVTEALLRLRKQGIKTWAFKTNPGIHRAVLNFAKTMDCKPEGDEHAWVFPLDSDTKRY